MTAMITAPHRVKARKNHRCDWCGKTIVQGEQYTDSVYVCDSIYNWRGCDRCAPYVDPMMRWIDDNYGRLSDEGYGPDDLREYMMEVHPSVWSAWIGKEAKHER